MKHYFLKVVELVLSPTPKLFIRMQTVCFILVIVGLVLLQTLELKKDVEEILKVLITSCISNIFVSQLTTTSNLIKDELNPSNDSNTQSKP